MVVQCSRPVGIFRETARERSTLIMTEKSTDLLLSFVVTLTAIINLLHAHKLVEALHVPSLADLGVFVEEHIPNASVPVPNRGEHGHMPE